jgi:hypothetical protein
MQKAMKILVAWISTFAATTAGAAVITFEGAVPSGLPLSNAMPYTEAGFTLRSSLADRLYHNDFFAPLAGLNTNGSTVIGWCADCGEEKTISITGTGLFTLQALDIATLNQGDAPDVLTITAVRSDGGSLTRQLSYQERWSTVHFTGYTDLVRVDIHSAGHADVAMDNLVLTAQVPEPAAVALWCAGLLVFAAGARHRQRS